MGENGLLNFSTPIMAIDAVIGLHVDHGNDLMKVNHLAIACYDGTIQIITYKMKFQYEKISGDNSGLRFCCARSSAFIVDGPVVSLHFGNTAEISLPHQGSHLFLVAGSLCGFASVFYKLPPPMPSSDNFLQKNSTPSFDGPLTVVEGLYTAQYGEEDCVTSVHICSGSRPAIVVGTQGGRVLLFQRYQDKEASSRHEIENQAMAMQEKDKWVSKMDRNKVEISRLWSEKEETDIGGRGLTGTIVERQRKVEKSGTGFCTENVDSLATKDENSDAKPTSDINLREVTTLKSAPIEQKVADHAHNIVDVTSPVDDLIGQSTAGKQNELKNVLICAGHRARKMHRYQILSEYRLPYPIHGIAGGETVCQYGDSERAIFVTTQRSFHVLRGFFSDSNPSRQEGV